MTDPPSHHLNSPLVSTTHDLVVDLEFQEAHVPRHSGEPVIGVCVFGRKTKPGLERLHESNGVILASAVLERLIKIDPRVALVWLVNELSRLNLTLRAGQVVTTGTCLVPLPINPGDRVACDFGTLGSVEVSFDG